MLSAVPLKAVTQEISEKLYRQQDAYNLLA
jgi:hypothetical protein